MKAFKGFKKDLTCRGFQYEEGKEYHTERAECCEEGFHACEYPLDCFGYYNPAESVFHEVELSGNMDKKNDDTKVCATDIKIGARISIAGLVKAAIDFTMSKVNKEKESYESHGFASATGDYGASSATGNCGASSATGYRGASSATGDYGASSATGNCGASSATGDYGASSATGDYGASSATGNCGASSATGYRGASSVSDPTGVAVAWGHEAKAKGCLGAHLILSDWRYIGEKWSDGDYKTPYNVESWELAGAKMVQVDGEKIKADTYYRCIDGEVVEAEE
jgi:hypothetical protein